MAADEKDGLLFSLKELKDIAANEPAPQARPVARASAAQRPAKKKKKSSSLLGDVSSLLADVQETVTADAAAEKARIEAEKEALRLAEEQAEAARRAKEEAEVAARLAAEQARQRAAEDEREARRREQDIAERRARGEIIEEDLPKAAPVVAQAATPAQVTPPAPLPRRGTGFYLAVIGLPIVCITAVVLAMILKPAEPTKPEIPLAATQLPQIAVVESSPPEEVLPVAIATEAPAPAPTSEAEEEAVGSTAKKKKKRRRRRSSSKKKTEKKPKKEKLKINLGGGGITF